MGGRETRTFAERRMLEICEPLDAGAVPRWRTSTLTTEPTISALIRSRPLDKF